MIYTVVRVMQVMPVREHGTLLFSHVNQCATWAKSTRWQHQKQVPVSKLFCQDMAL